MPITGKDIHEAFRQVKPFAVLPAWEDIHPAGHTTYEAVAEKLNEHSTSPLPEQAAGPLTGEALFQLHRTVQPYDLEWSDIGQSAQDFYNNIAGKLNTTYIHPLSEQTAGGAMITGKDIHQLLVNPRSIVDSWDVLLPVSQKVYNCYADKLNAQFLAPLQGLVGDWQELVQAHEEMDVESLTEIEDWDKEWQTLKKRTQSLHLVASGPQLFGTIPLEAGVAMTNAIDEQGKRIDALKALVLSYRSFVVRTCPGSVFFSAEVTDLFHATTQVLNGERKEK